MKGRALSLSTLLGILAGCGDSLSPVGDRELLPRDLQFVAVAFSVDANGRKVDCGIDTYITLGTRVDRSETLLVQYGEGGGDARRYVDKASGNTVGFWAHTYFRDLRFHLIGADSIEIRSPESEGVPERFWREFALFAGNTRNADPLTGALAQGSWTCQPMDTPESSGEYHDVEGTARGTWILRRGVS
jgi:hypothetical protein